MNESDERQAFGQEIIDWIEATCRVPEGALVGQPFGLMDWQKREILKIYNNPASGKLNDLKSKWIGIRWRGIERANRARIMTGERVVDQHR
jgi:hypothetical protein